MASKQSKNRPGRHRSSVSVGASEATPPNLLLTLCTWAGRVLVLGILAACPWFYGSVTWTAQSWLVPVVALAFLFAIAVILIGFAQKSQRQMPSVLSSPFSLSLWCLLIIALFQSITLPEGVWDFVAPAASFQRRVEVLAETYDSVGELKEGGDEQLLESPTTLSIDPAQTKASLSVFAAGLAMLISAGVLFRGSVGNLVLLSTLVLTVLSNTILGLFQSIVWNDWTLLEMPSKVYFSTFVSRNSAPQFMAIGMAASIGLLAWWSSSKSDSDSEKKYNVRYPAVNAVARLRRRMEELIQDLDFFSIVLVFTITFMFVGVIAAASRGGILSCVFAVFVTLAMTLGKKTDTLIKAVGLLVAVSIVAVLLLTTLDLQSIALERLDTISAEAYQLNNGRLDVWRMSVSEPAYWLAGCGLGTFHFGILPCYDGTEAVWFYHAENIFVELFVEFGIAGFVIGIAGLVFLVSQIFKERERSGRNPMFFPAVVFALAAVSMQSLVDFSLIIPAIFLPLAAIIGCFLGESATGQPSKRSRSMREPEAVKRKSFRQFPGTHGVVVATIIFAMFYGNSSLRGYAAAERLDKQAGRWEAAAMEGNAELPEIEFTPQMLEHPEFAFQMARLEQEVIEYELSRVEAWETETDTPEKLRKSLCAPETVAAAVRGGAQGKLAEFAKLLSKETALVAQLSATRERMKLAAAASPLDWRPAWGIVRSDLGELSSESRDRNYAKLALATKHKPGLAQTIGTTAFLAGEREVGIDLWRRTLTANPSQTNRLTPWAGEAIDSEALNELLPPSPLGRIELARNLLQSRGRGDELMVEKTNQIVESILPSANVKEISAYAIGSQDWRLVGWYAERVGEVDEAVEAYKQAALKSPLDHTVRYQLAKLLESNNEIADAISQMENACRLSPINAGYKKYLKSLEDRSKENVD